jgi:hypothetical protein
MSLIVAVVINSDADSDGGGGRSSSGSDNWNDRNSDNSDGSRRNSSDCGMEQINRMDGEETVLAMVEMGTGITAESI